MDKYNNMLKHGKKFSLRAFTKYLNKTLMPHISVNTIERHIRKLRSSKVEDNPIKQYFQSQKLPLCDNYIWPLSELKYLPLSKRNPDTLPILWKKYLYKDQTPTSSPALPLSQKEKIATVPIKEKKVKQERPLILSPVLLYPTNFFGYNELSHTNSRYRKIVPKQIIFQPVNQLPKKRGHRKKNHHNFQIIAPFNEFKNINNCLQTIDFQTVPNILIPDNLSNISITMLPDMPNLEASMSNSINNANNNQSSRVVNVTNNPQNTDNSSNSEKIQDFSNIISKCSGNDLSPKILENQQNQIEFCLPSTSANSDNVEKDNLDDINELMIASSTVKTVNKKELSCVEKKRARLRREFLANLALTTPEDPLIADEKDSRFISNYYEKLSTTLEPEEYKNLLQILIEFDENTNDFITFYKSVQSILLPKYQELSEEFLLFLTDKQAYEVGQFMNYLVIKDMSNFTKKLNIYFKDQPLQFKRLFKCLTDLSENPNLTIENIKTSISPFFKNSPMLKEWFLQLFPGERPSKMLTNLPYEVIDLSKEITKSSTDDEFVETIILPDTEDHYGGVNCICECHNETTQNKPKTTHCRECGMKFIQGKAYVQNGKKLHPVNITFPFNTDTDHLKRLNVVQRKRSDNSPSKQLSPSKDYHDDVRNDESDKSKKRNQLNNPKRPKKRKHADKSETNKNKAINNKDNNSKEKNKRSSSSSNSSTTKSNSSSKAYKTTRKKRKVAKKIEYKKNNESSIPGQQSPANEENIEQKMGSDHSLEYESDKQIESSQDNTNTEDSEYLSDNSNSSLNCLNSSDSSVTWSRDEDKIILETFQQITNNDETFRYLSQLLPNRSISEIKNRFRKLMSLVHEMVSNSS